MKSLMFALVLALSAIALAGTVYANCGGKHTTASSDQIAQPAPPPPPPARG